MKFENIKIKNFRNFEDININLDNKNVVFGMNDVGKTNFLYALRYIFDKDIRKQNFIDSDYYKKNINKNIEILISIDISDHNNEDCQKIRAIIKGNLKSNENKVYIRLIAEYNKSELIGIPTLYWGGDLENLQEMKYKGIFYEIDEIFNPIYIDAYVDLYAMFKKNISQLLFTDEKKMKVN